MIMDYIYRNSQEEKCVGTIEGLVITPVYDFSIKIKDEIMWCQMEHLLNEWCIHFIDIRKNVELAHPRDVYWNMKAIYEVFEDIEISLKIAYGIKAIYEKTIENA